MQTLSWLKSLLTFNETVLDQSFVLSSSENGQNASDDTALDPDGREHADGRREEIYMDQADANRSTVQEHRTADHALHMLSTPQMVTRVQTVQPKSWDDFRGARRTQPASMGGPMDECVPANLDDIREKLNETFHLPDNKDIVVRDFTIGIEPRWHALAVFVDGMSDKMVINNFILQPLMLLTRIIDDEHDITRRLKVVSQTLVPGNQIQLTEKWSELVTAILAGSTVLFIDGCPSGLAVETKGWEHRSVSAPQTETVVRGPHDAFTENFRANTGLVRAKMRSPDLVTEMMTVGELGRTDIAIMYIHGLTNPKLVEEVKRRINDIEIDFLADSGPLEQMIEDSPTNLIPQVLSTERPDHIAHLLTEGHVAIFVGNSPFVLAVPIVFWTMMQTPEDAYLLFPFGSFIRMIRWLALFTALFMPALYVSATNYHPEMIPTDLLLSIAGSREQVPFPVIAEVLMMEFAIELIREAGIRVPSVIGPTIGIVGALIIGQAAVQAGIVSPLLVIVVATTALASFTIPNYNLNFGVRLMRFVFLFAAAIFGFYGIALAVCMVLARICVQKSFGVPLLAPVAPKMSTSPDVFMRGPEYTMNERPSYLHTLRNWRQSPISRAWSSKSKRKASAGIRRGRKSPS